MSLDLPYTRRQGRQEKWMEEPWVAQVFILHPKLPDNLGHSLCMKLFMSHYWLHGFLPQYLCLLLPHFLILRYLYLTTSFFHLKIFWAKLISGNIRIINSEKFILPSKLFWICLVSLKEIKLNLHNTVPCTSPPLQGKYCCKSWRISAFNELEADPWAAVVQGFQLLSGRRGERLSFSENGWERTYNLHPTQASRWEKKLNIAKVKGNEELCENQEELKRVTAVYKGQDITRKTKIPILWHGKKKKKV